MALTRGISFRRQGSSGLTWADTWTFTEDGALVLRRPKEESLQQSIGSRSRAIGLGERGSDPSTFSRSKSVGSAGPQVFGTNSSSDSHHKSGSRVVRWLKKTFTKFRN